ncbi:MAG: aspartyl protease family protein [Sedimentisphaerales bacterium]
MMKMLYKSHKRLISILLITFCLVSAARADKSDWKSEKVRWLAGPGGVIKGIRYPEGENPETKTSSDFQLFSMESGDSQILGNVIDSPPISGFVPRIAVNVTNSHSDDLDWVGQPRNSVVGNYLTNNPEKNFIIGLFDTGASTCIISNAGAEKVGIFSSDLLTPNTIELAGATSSTFGRVSMPLAVFMGGLSSIDPNTMLLNDANMVGESNISVVVGEVPEPNMPDLPTVVGSPVSVYFVTGIFNDNPISVTYDGNNYTAPDIRFYNQYDSDIPEYTNKIPLNLIPAGASDVEYFPDLDAIYSFIFRPGSPSVIGGLIQSLFFVSSVDLIEGSHSSLDKNRFMLDTGAQVTVISSEIAARLGLDPANEDFEVEIQDVTGEITYNPGFYVDSLQIAALGEWLSFTNVPVVMLDVDSPEGGYLNGIIGMNLFTEYNLVLHGGGLIGQDPPFLTYQKIPPRLIGDIAPEGGDGIVNFLDFAVLAKAWLATPASKNWNPTANIAPRYSPDSIIDYLDLMEMTQSWLRTLQTN